MVGSLPVVRWGTRIVWAAITLPLPLTLLWISIHKPGINLKSATSFDFSLDAFSALLFDASPLNEQFRAGVVRSMLYSIVAATIAMAISIGFTLLLVRTQSRRATSLAFVLLGFVLLPQTFLILAILKLAKLVGVVTANPVLIAVFLATGLIPLSCWATYILIGEDTRQLLHLTALDGLTLSRALGILFQTHAIIFSQVFLLCLTLGIGNFLLPFALGDNRTYTALVSILSFSSNVGRDWATVAAAGTILVIPIALIAVMTGIAIARRL